jgi:dihydroorotase
MLTMAQTNRPADLLLRGARVVDPAQGTDEFLDISIRQGRIAAIGLGIAASPGQREIDAAGWCVMPAFVDPHVHVRVPGGEHVESIATGTAAAARGGYGAIVSMPNTNPVVDSPELLRSLHRDAAREAVVPIGFAAAISVGQQGDQLAELCELADAGAIVFSDDGRPVRSAALLRRAMQYQAVARLPFALHCEDLELSAGGVMHEGPLSFRLGMAAQPVTSEWLAIARDVRLAYAEGARVHVQHVSTAPSVDEIAWAKSNGALVSAEATPHHLLLTDEACAGFDTNAKMNPPLRSAEHRDALVEAVRTGTIDCVATDHAPHDGERKDEPFEQAPFGVTGLETAFAALYTGLVQPGVLTLSRLVEAMSSAPARAVGIDVPRIEVGAPAQLSAWQLDTTWTVDPATGASRSHNAAFAGRTLQGWCVMTVAAGAVVHEAQSPVAVPA